MISSRGPTLQEPSPSCSSSWPRLIESRLHGACANYRCLEWDCAKGKGPCQVETRKLTGLRAVICKSESQHCAVLHILTGVATTKPEYGRALAGHHCIARTGVPHVLPVAVGPFDHPQPSDSTAGLTDLGAPRRHQLPAYGFPEERQRKLPATLLWQTLP